MSCLPIHLIIPSFQGTGHHSGCIHCLPLWELPFVGQTSWVIPARQMTFTSQCIGGLETPVLETVLSTVQGSSWKVWFKNSCTWVEYPCLHGAQDCFPLFGCEEFDAFQWLCQASDRTEVTNHQLVALISLYCLETATQGLQQALCTSVAFLSLLKEGVIATGHL